MPTVCLFLRPIAWRAVCFSDDQRRTARAADALERMDFVFGKSFWTRRDQNNIGQAFLRQDVGLIQPCQKCRHTDTMSHDGNISADDMVEGRLNGVLPFGNGLPTIGFGSLNNRIADRSAIYPHFRFIRIAYQKQCHFFEFEALHFRRPI